MPIRKICRINIKKYAAYRRICIFICLCYKKKENLKINDLIVQFKMSEIGQLSKCKKMEER